MKHLELIQGIINRMSGSLFYLKGWAITLIAGLFALSAKESTQDYFYIAFFPVIIFWILDGYFLSHERAFRHLYDDVAKIQDDDNITFSMDIKEYKKYQYNTWGSAMISPTLRTFYGLLILMMLILMCVINKCLLNLFCLL